MTWTGTGTVATAASNDGTTTLADMTRYVAEAIPDAVLYSGTATSGSATTLVDTANSEPDDFYDNGTLWVLSGNNEGKYALITDWDLATHTFTFATMTLVCAAGDQYLACNQGYNRDLLKRSVNQALQDIGKRLATKTGWCGKVTSASTTTITDSVLALEETFIADYFNGGRLTFLTGVHEGESIAITDFASGVFTFSVLSYTPDAGDDYVVIPDGVNDIRRIVSDGSKNYWWKEISDGVVVFDGGHEPASNAKVVFYYMSPHAVLSDYDDTIDPMIPLDAIKWMAVERAMLARIGRDKSNDKFLYTLLQDVKVKAEQARVRNRLPVLARDTHLPDFGG